MDRHKRSAEQAGLPYHQGGPSKSARIQDGLQALDLSVKMKFKQILADKLLTEEELDPRVLEELISFPPPVALEILDIFCQTDSSRLATKSGYIIGIMKKFRQRQPGGGPPGHRPPPPPPPKPGMPDPLAGMPPDVANRLESLMLLFGFTRADLDDRCVDAFTHLPPPVSLHALDILGKRDFSHVRNMPGFIMSAVKQAQDDMPPGSFDMGPVPVPYAPVPPAVVPAAVPTYVPVMPSGVIVAAPPPAPAAYGAPVPEGVPATMVNRPNYGAEQAQLGVRTNEFHDLSPFATYVHPAPALKLQQLWDQGIKLVGAMDDRAFEAVAELDAPDALIIIDEVAAKMQGPDPPRNPNAFMMACLKKFMERKAAISGGPAPPMQRNGPPGGGYAPGPAHDSYHDRHYGGGPGGDDGFYGGPPGPRDDRGYGRGRGRGRGPRPYSPSSSRRGGGGGYDRDPEPGYGRGGGYGERPYPRGPGGRPPGYDKLPGELRQRVDALLARPGLQGVIGREHFDEGVVDMLTGLTPDDAHNVLQELGENDLAGVRNLPAYIMGICKRYRQGGAPGRGGYRR